MKKFDVAILGATGVVGQRFINLLNSHPFFNIKILAASKNSEGKLFKEAVKDKSFLENENISKDILNMRVLNVNDAKKIAYEVDFVFCAVEMPKEELKELENTYAKLECPVISNNSAHRFTSDVPIVIPEINAHHLKIIESQRKRFNTKKGFITAKPNCSLQSFIPPLAALVLNGFKIKNIIVSTYQAISGAGKTFKTFPQIIDNIIPFIKDEEDKTQNESLKILGEMQNDKIILNNKIKISAKCIRVPVSNGHLCSVFVEFDQNKPSKKEILNCWKEFKNLSLNSSPSVFFNYCEDVFYPQTKVNRDEYNGMSVHLGGLEEDNVFDYKFVCLTNNIIRGAAGGAILLAELLVDLGYIC